MTTYSKLASVSATREVLEAFGLHTNKALGQHFLIDDGVVGRIIRLADIKLGQSIVEVGPGIGTLTLALLAAGAQVNAVEMDKKLLGVLASTLQHPHHSTSVPALVAGSMSQIIGPATSAGTEVVGISDNPNLNIIGADALDIDTVIPQFTQPPTALVANLPYAVGATIVLDYFTHLPELQTATVMLQKEVAARMMAQPNNKDYGAYTVKLRLLAQPVQSFNVAPSNFFPPPKVDSTVIKLERTGQVTGTQNGTPGAGSQVSGPQVSRFSGHLGPVPKCPAPSPCHPTSFVINAAFAQRRKTIRNSMRSYFQTNNQDPNLVDELLSAANIAPTTRGETLGIDAYRHLGAAFLAHLQKSV